MKKFNLFAYAAMAAITLSFAACTDDEPEISKPGPQIDRGEKCRIESFELNLSEGNETLFGYVYDYDKTIDLEYMITQLAGMREATATVKLSEGATITPDPSVPADYTQPVQFTVTGADGKTTRTYTTRAVEKVVKTYTKVSKFAEKTTAEMGVGDKNTYKTIGTSGTNIVIYDKVFDGKSLSPIGTLNMTGFETLKIVSLSSDSAGHLIASLSADGGNTPPVTIACWKNGYDQPAEEIIKSETGAIANLISAGGNLVEGKALVSAMGSPAATGPHFCWGFVDGVRTDYYNLLTGMSSADGNWSQMVSPCSGNIDGQWFLWESPNAEGSYVATWSGWSGQGSINLIAIPGVIPKEDPSNGGAYNWGNLRVGSVRGFTFNNTAYGALFVEGWDAGYLGIVDSEGNYILSPLESVYKCASRSANYRLVGTYAYHEKENNGYVYMLDPESATFVVYKLEIAIE